MNIDANNKNLDRISDRLKSVDQKVAIFLAFQGIILTGIAPVIFKVATNDYFLANEYFIFFSITILFFLFYGTAKSIFAITPQLKNNHKKSVLYFKDIALMGVADFKKRVGNINEKEYENCILEQIHILSCIATKKHEQFRDAIIIFCFGIFLLLTCLFAFFNYCYVGI